jgi:hypothetical protein
VKGSIGVATFSRAEQLDKCISSIVRAKGLRDIPLLVLHQLGDPKVKQVISKWRSHIFLLIELNPNGRTALQNINLNSILLRHTAFNFMDSDWFLGIEEDVVIGGDSITFIESMMGRYINKRAFRGVNLGSNLPRENNTESHYSKMRYGMQGQASAITRRTWKKFDFDHLVKNSSWGALDGMMENHLKSGFMCNPLLSRYVDNGWSGTHGLGDPSHEFYRKFENSFIDLLEKNQIEYFENKVRIPLREDAVLYNPMSTFFHVIKNYLSYKYFTAIKRWFLSFKN